MPTSRLLMTTISVRDARPADAPAIARIYNYFVRNTVVTFEEEPVSAESMAARIVDVQGVPLPWLVAEIDGLVVGYAYANRWKSRSAYRNSVETTIYLEHGREGGGLGTKLYARLLDELQESRRHAIIGGTALPNEASV